MTLLTRFKQWRARRWYAHDLKRRLLLSDFQFLIKYGIRQGDVGRRYDAGLSIAATRKKFNLPDFTA